MSIGQAIKDNRKRFNMTQAELADQLGLSQETIANYEAGIRKPPIDTVAAMAHIFGITVDDLLLDYPVTESSTAFIDIAEDLIKRNGITKSRLLSDLGLNRNSFVDWKNRGNVPSAETVSAIADYFGVSIEYLLGKEGGSSGTLLESRSILDEGMSFEGTLSISDRKYRISLSIAPAGEEMNG